MPIAPDPSVTWICHVYIQFSDQTSQWPYVLNQVDIIESIPPFINAVRKTNPRWKEFNTKVSKTFVVPYRREVGKFIFAFVNKYKDPKYYKQSEKRSQRLYPEARDQSIEFLTDLINLAELWQLDTFRNVMGYCIAQHFIDTNASIDEIGRYLGGEITTAQLEATIGKMRKEYAEGPKKPTLCFVPIKVRDTNTEFVKIPTRDHLVRMPYIFDMVRQLFPNWKTEPIKMAYPISLPYTKKQVNFFLDHIQDYDDPNNILEERRDTVYADVMKLPLHEMKVYLGFARFVKCRPFELAMRYVIKPHLKGLSREACNDLLKMTTD
ncbi:hypothetical protein CAEBREN_19123 [Caenorhabditis brenneri]|uniref:Uncharacterized protein n=1 Tax=Caenorhabditis brenneri TaxID=135651 RepID=G0MC01_CAEBE|nr:hypothetical protein CAEBREN_19123 [Caenorhabditis brenneri]